jgi:hypothetical protein
MSKYGREVWEKKGARKFLIQGTDETCTAERCMAVGYIWGGTHTVLYVVFRNSEK